MALLKPFLVLGIFAQNGQFKALNISALNVKVLGIISLIAFSVGDSNDRLLSNDWLFEDRNRICCGCGRI